MKVTKELIGERIGILRGEMTQKELAEKSGVGLSTIKNTESKQQGRALSKIDDLLRIAEALNVSPYQLLTGNDDENHVVCEELGLASETVNTLKTANDPRIQKAIDIMVRNRDILPFLFHFFTDPDTVFESSGVYIKTDSGERIPNPTYTQSDMERLCRLKLLDDLQAIREENKGGKAK